MPGAGPGGAAEVEAVVAALLAAAAVALACSPPARVRVPDTGHRGRARDPATGADVRVPGRTAGRAGSSGGATPEERPAGAHGAVRLAAALAAAVTAWAFVPGLWGLLAAAVAAGTTWWRSRTWEPAAERRRRLRLEAELPWLVDLLTAALRAGLGPVEALRRVAEVSRPEVRQELLVPLARLGLGVDPVAVWSELATHPELGRLGVTLRRATESGAPVVDALARLGADLRAGQRAAVEVGVRRIEVRAALPLGACLLPAFVLLAVVPLVAGSASRLLAG